MPSPIGPLVAGVDSSTQSTKVVVRRLEDGVSVAEGRAPHPTTEPPKSEQDPNSWWSALAVAFSDLKPVAGGPDVTGDLAADIVGISFSGQQHGFVTLDEDGSPIRPAKLWNDTESAVQAERLAAELGADVWAETCGVVPVASITVTKLAWLVENEPAAVSRIHTMMLPHDYLTWRLTGRAVTDRGDASGTGWWDPSSGEYRQDLLAAAGADRDLSQCLPVVLAPTETAGTVTAEAAEALGLSTDCVVGPGTGDNMAAALGLGLRAGEVAMSLGTSGTVFGVSSEPAKDPSGIIAGFADANGRYLPLACTLNATKVTDMFANVFGLDHGQFAALALEGSPGASGVTVVPYFDGERTPNLPDATGSVSGLRPGTDRADLARAAHEGVLCNLLEAADALAAVGVAGDGELRLVGGGAKSPAYQQILAELHQGPIRIPDDDEAPATGAAVQAAAVAGQDSIDEVTDRWALRSGGTSVAPGFAANPSIRERYRTAAATVAG